MRTLHGEPTVGDDALASRYGAGAPLAAALGTSGALVIAVEMLGVMAVPTGT